MNPSARIKTLLGILFVTLLTIFLHEIHWLRPIEIAIRSVINVSSGTLYQWTIGLHTTSLKNVSSSTPKNITTEEFIKWQNAISEVTLLSDENKQLRAQLNFFAKTPLIHVGAEVIGRDIEPVGNTIMINRGSANGVARGQAVVIAGGLLIGKIARAEPDMAIVQLINDGQSKVAATILNHDRSLGIVEGGYGLSVRMSFIPQNEVISLGDMIVTSGLEPGIPRGLLIGTVDAVEKEAYQPFQRAILTPMSSLDKLSLVSVLIDNTTTTTSL